MCAPDPRGTGLAAPVISQQPKPKPGTDDAPPPAPPHPQISPSLRVAPPPSASQLHARSCCERASACRPRADCSPSNAAVCSRWQLRLLATTPPSLCWRRETAVSTPAGNLATPHCISTKRSQQTTSFTRESIPSCRWNLTRKTWPLSCKKPSDTSPAHQRQIPVKMKTVLNLSATGLPRVRWNTARFRTSFPSPGALACAQISSRASTRPRVLPSLGTFPSLACTICMPTL